MSLARSIRRVIALVCLALPAAAAVAQSGDQIFLYPYFNSNGENGVFLAWSEDGKTFNTLNGGNAIFTPPQWSNNDYLTRDPSITYRDGLFHMVWTSDWNGNNFGYASSPDLKTWSTPKQVFPFANLSSSQQPSNVWAPEIHFDPASSSYFIVWASTTQDVNSRHRQFYTRTTDFVNFTDAAVFFDKGWSVIDSHAAFDDRGTADTSDDRWVMIVKNETGTSSGGKNLRSTTLGGNINWDSYNPSAWSAVSSPIAGSGGQIQSGSWAEGPTLLKDGDQWLLYWDKYTSGDWGMASSTDLVTWTDLTSQFHLYAANGNEITHPRHGTIFLAPRSAVGFAGVPEPTALSLLALGSALVLSRRRCV